MANMALMTATAPPADAGLNEKEIGYAQGIENVDLEKMGSTSTPSSTAFEIPTDADKAAVVRKLDWRLLPMVFILYTLSVLDRSNLGNAKLAGLENSVDLSGNHYNWLGTLFYIAYILFQWTTIGYKQFKAHKWIAITVFYWGFVATIQATVTNWGGLMTCRFFLGIAEAMFGPGVPFFLSFFYPRDKVGFRVGVFISGAAAANAYGSALAYGITQIHSSHIQPWQILFIIEGIPTCLLAIVMWFAIPDSIDSARFLNDREKEVAKYFVSQNQKVDNENKGLDLSEYVEAFKDPKSFVPAIMYFSCNVSFASLPLFIPTIIEGIGTFSQIESNGLSAPPYVLCFLSIILVTWLSDKTRVRGPWCAGPAFIAAVGFIMLATTETTGPRYAGVFLATLIFISVAILLTWTNNMHATESKRAGGFTILATIGQCGPLLGTNVFPESEGPFYRKGMWISASFCLLVGFCSIFLSLWLIHENKKIDKETAERNTARQEKGEHGQLEHVPDDAKECDTFRYIW